MNLIKVLIYFVNVIASVVALPLINKIPESPCPETFSYEKENESFYGKVTIPSNMEFRGYHKLYVVLHLPKVLLKKNYGSIFRMENDWTEICGMVRQTGEVHFKINFPVQNPLPLLNYISFNGEKICTGSSVDRGTEIWHKYHLKYWCPPNYKSEVTTELPEELPTTTFPPITTESMVLSSNTIIPDVFDVELNEIEPYVSPPIISDSVSNANAFSILTSNITTENPNETKFEIIGVASPAIGTNFSDTEKETMENATPYISPELFVSTINQNINTSEIKHGSLDETSFQILKTVSYWQSGVIKSITEMVNGEGGQNNTSFSSETNFPIVQSTSNQNNSLDVSNRNGFKEETDEEAIKVNPNETSFEIIATMSSPNPPE